MEEFDQGCHEMLKSIYEQNRRILQDGKKRERQWFYGFAILGIFIVLGFFI